jgi:hypothetical protein
MQMMRVACAEVLMLLLMYTVDLLIQVSLLDTQLNCLSRAGGLAMTVAITVMMLLVDSLTGTAVSSVSFWLSSLLRLFDT